MKFKLFTFETTFYEPSYETYMEKLTAYLNTLEARGYDPVFIRPFTNRKLISSEHIIARER